MRSGELRDRGTITGIAELPDGHFGFTDQSVVIAARIPAKVEQLAGRELDRAQQIDPRSTHQIAIRYRTDIKSGMTFTHHDGRRGDRPFEIVAPPRELDDQHRQLRLLCREAA